MDILLFDLDNTLYSPERELFPLIDERINRYMNEVAGIPLGDVDTLRRSVLAALRRHHAGTHASPWRGPEDYLAYVHDIDVSLRLQPDPHLRATLSAVPLRKAVFTNSSRDHSERVLQALGLAGLFEEIFDIRIANYLPKPSPEPYHAVLEKIELPASPASWSKIPRKISARKKALGMGTVLVGTLPTQPISTYRFPAAADISSALSHGTVPLPENLTSACQDYLLLPLPTVTYG